MKFHTLMLVYIYLFICLSKIDEQSPLYCTETKQYFIVGGSTSLQLHHYRKQNEIKLNNIITV